MTLETKIEFENKIEELETELEIANNKIADLVGTLEDISYTAKQATK